MTTQEALEILRVAAGIGQGKYKFREAEALDTLTRRLNEQNGAINYLHRKVRQLENGYTRNWDAR